MEAIIIKITRNASQKIFISVNEVLRSCFRIKNYYKTIIMDVWLENTCKYYISTHLGSVSGPFGAYISLLQHMFPMLVMAHKNSQYLTSFKIHEKSFVWSTWHGCFIYTNVSWDIFTPFGMLLEEPKQPEFRSRGKNTDLEEHLRLF